MADLYKKYVKNSDSKPNLHNKYVKNESNIQEELKNRILNWNNRSNTYINQARVRYTGATGTMDSSDPKGMLRNYKLDMNSWEADKAPKTSSSYTGPQFSASGKYEGGFKQDASEWYTKMHAEKSFLDTEAQAINDFIRDNDKYISGDVKTAWNKLYSASQESQNSALSTAKLESNLFGDYETEEDFIKGYEKFLYDDKVKTAHLQKEENILTVMNLDLDDYNRLRKKRDEARIKKDDAVYLRERFKKENYPDIMISGKTQEEINDIKRQIKEQREQREADFKPYDDAVAKAEAEIADIQRQIEEFEKTRLHVYGGSYDGLLEALKSQEGLVKDIKNYQDLYELEHIYELEDYQKYSDIGKGMTDYSLSLWNEDELEGYSTTAARDFEDIYIYIREKGMPLQDEINDWLPFAPGITDHAQDIEDIALGMTQKEYDAYAYYAGKGDEEKKKLIIDTVRNRLIMEEAQEKYEFWGGDDASTLVQVANRFSSEFGSFFDNVKYNFTSYYPMESEARDVATAQVHSDLKDKDHGMLSSVVGGIGNQLPSIVASMIVTAATGNPTVGSLVGNVSMGVSASGSAYRQAIEMGYDEWDARSYGALVGGSELAIGSLLSGVASMGGSLTSKGISALTDSIDDVILKAGTSKIGRIAAQTAKIAVEHGGRMASEFGEEYLQAVLEPWYQNILLGTDNSINPFSKEVLEAGLVGALSAGVINASQSVATLGVNTGTKAINNYQTGKQLKADGIDVNQIADIGKTFSADTVAYKIANKVDENTGAYTIGKLFNEVNATMSEQNKSEIIDTLVNKGVLRADAEILVDSIETSMALGEDNFSVNERYILDNNPALNEAVREVLVDKNTTLYQRISGAVEINKQLTEKALQKVANKLAKGESVSDEEIDSFAEETDLSVDTMEAESITASADEVSTESTPNRVMTESKTYNNVDNAEAAVSPVEKIVSTKDGKVKYQTKDGETVDASEAVFRNEDEAVIYETALDMGLPAAVINYAVNEYDSNTASALEYIYGVRTAYEYGASGIHQSYISSDALSALSYKQRQDAYELGKAIAQDEVATRQKAIGDKVSKSKNAEKRKGTVQMDGKEYKVDTGEGLTEVQKESVNAAKFLATVLGNDINLYNSYIATEGEYEGRRVYKKANGEVALAPNGFYNPDGSINIDINAGSNGEGIILETLGHELTHHIRAWSPAKFKVMADFLFDQYYKHGVDVQSLIHEQIAKAKRNGRTISYDIAYEEVVADAFSRMLTDTDAISKLAKTDKGLYNKVKAWVKGIVNKINKLYSRYDPNSKEAQYVKKMNDVASELQRLWLEGLEDARDTYRKIEVEHLSNIELKYELRKDETGKTFVSVDENAIDLNNGRSIAENISLILKNFDNIIEVKGQKIRVNKMTNDEWRVGSAARQLLKTDMQAYNDKIKAIANADDILKVANNWVGEKVKHTRKDSVVEFARGNVRYKVANNGYIADVLVAIKKDGSAVLYELVNIIPTKITEPSSYQGRKSPRRHDSSAMEGTIPQQSENSQQKFSGRDSDGNTLSKEQQEFFKDSKVRDEKGNLLVVYHGTQKADFTVFKRNFNFYTDNKEMADSYANKSEMYTGYLNIANPYIIDAKGEKWSKISIDNETKDMLDRYGSSTFKEGGKWRTTPADIAYAILDGIDEGEFDYDGIIIKNVNDTGSYYKSNDNIIADDYITFNSNQFKDVDNKTPTSDADIYYSGRDSFTYENLIRKPDMKGITIKKSQKVKLLADGSIDAAFIVSEVHQRCQKVQTGGASLTYFTNVPDIDRNVEITKKGIVHGFFDSTKKNKKPSPRDLINARVSFAIPEILATSIEVNQSYRTGNIDIPYSHIMMGTIGLENEQGNIEYYAVRSVVEERTNQNPILVEAKILGKLHAVNAKKIGSPNLKVAKKNVARRYDETYSYSVADLLNDVKDVFDDTFSVDVYNHFEKQRKNNDFSKNLIYSERDTDGGFSQRYLLMNALESTAQTAEDKKRLAEYKSKLGMLSETQERLHKVKTKIKELSFGKGKRDTEQLANLKRTAKELTDLINRYDKKLFSLESTDSLKRVLEVERKRAYAKATEEGRNNLQAYKDKMIQREQNIREKYQESRANAVEKRSKTEMKNKIKKRISKLNTLLLKQTKDKHVPIELQKSVAKMLKIVNLDEQLRVARAEKRMTAAEEKYTRLLEKEKAKENPDAELIEFYQQKLDENTNTVGKVSEAIQSLKNAYHEITTSNDSIYVNNPEIEKLLDGYRQYIGDTQLSDMTLQQLNYVYNSFKIVDHMISEANKGHKLNRSKTISDYAEEAVGEVRESHKTKTRTLSSVKIGKSEIKVPHMVSNFKWDYKKPWFAFRSLGSKVMNELYDNLRKGEDTWAVDTQNATKKFEELAEKYDIQKWNFDKKIKCGNVEITLDQLLSLYAYSKREAADKHLAEGGFVFDSSVKLRKGKKGIFEYQITMPEPQTVSKTDMIELMANLTDDMKAWADEMQDYLSSDLSAIGNGVSRELYGINLFNEKHYFPIKAMQEVLDFNAEKHTDIVPNITNMGMTKPVLPNANNTIVLGGFTDIWARHCNDMAKYHAFALAMDDFTKVYNYGKGAQSFDKSVKVAIKNAKGLGDAANKYIQTFLQDVNGGVRADEMQGIDALISKFKKSSVMASASVFIQQFSAIARAFGMINPKYFVKTDMNINHAKTVAEMEKYAPIAIVKRLGGFDINTGEGTVDIILGKDNKGLIKKSNNALGYAPQKADEFTWCAIWKACKREAKHKYKLEGEELLKKAGEKFTEVVQLTQVYDSVFSRNAMMRSKGTFNKMVTSFMAEPITSLNGILYAYKQMGQGNIKKGVALRSAFFAATVLNSLLSALPYAWRDDDEDETFAEKYISSAVGETLEGLNPITCLPVIKDIYSLAQGYDVERTDMALVSDVIDKVGNIITAYSNREDDMTDEELAEAQKEIEQAWIDAGFELLNLFGIPADNLRREIVGIAQTVTRDNDYETTWSTVMEAISEKIRDAKPFGRLTDDESKSDKIYQAIAEGDTEMLKRLKDSYKTEKAYESAVRQGLRDNDERIKAAAKAGYEGNERERVRICKEIIAEGLYSQDMIVKAVNAEINKLAKDEPEEEKEDTSEYESDVIYKASDINDAIEYGDIEGAYEIINELVEDKKNKYLFEADQKGERLSERDAEKKAKSSLKGTLTSHWKDIYIKAYKNGDDEECKRIRQILGNSNLWDRKSEVSELCRNWLKEARKK